MGAINKHNFKGGGQGGSTENVCKNMRSSGEDTLDTSDREEQRYPAEAGATLGFF